MRKTKIVATIGPATDSIERMTELVQAGVDVFRFNMKHSTVEWHAQRIARAHQVAEQLGRPVAILVDLQGPEIRVATPKGEPFIMKTGDLITLGIPTGSSEGALIIDDPRVPALLTIGQRVLIDDGQFEFQVTKKSEEEVVLESLTTGTLLNHKGMNIPGIELDLKALIESDLERLDMAARENVDFVALSFIHSRHDVELLRKEMDLRTMDAQIVGKIENAQALENLHDIIAACDALMVARGDLGIEVPMEQLAYWQKTIIEKCREAGKPVITATQMLQSMIQTPRPTRAEVTDVANAVFDGSDAVMLSGETAFGAYPFLAVATMNRIVTFNEKKARLTRLVLDGKLDQTEVLTRAAMTVVAAQAEFPLSAIIVSTTSGRTVRALARFRPPIPIIALARSAKVRDQLSLVYGVTPLLVDFPAGTTIDFGPIVDYLKDRDIVSAGNHVLFIHGLRWSEPGKTDTLVIEEIH